MARAGDQFMAIHRHGFVRVASCTPLSATADPAANAAATIALAREADAKGVDLAVFPELGLSSYAIDDLLLQDALLDGAEAALGEVIAASASLGTVLLVGIPLRRNGRLYNCAAVVARGRLLGVVPNSFLLN